MTHLVQDLWHELREKRLWPVAVLLALALVAVPVLLLERGDEPGTPAAGQPVPRDDLGKLAVRLSGDSSSTSSLDLFGEKDPFRPRGRKPGAATQATAQSSVTVPPTGGGGLPPGTGVGGAVGGAVGDAVGGGAAAPSGAPSSGAGGGGGSAGPGRTRRRTSAFTYVIDVTFSRNGRGRRLRGLQRLAMLPSADTPLLLFLGVDSSGDNAVFLVDSTLDARGEGDCRPSGPECSVLTIGAGSEHRFTDERGNAYELRVDEIRRVRVGRASSSSRARARSSARSRRAGKARRSRARRPFSLPDLADLVLVSTESRGR